MAATFWIRCWREHSLTLALAAIGLGCYGLGLALHCWATEWTRTSDFLYNIGHGFFPLAVYNGLAGRFREVNRPED